MSARDQALYELDHRQLPGWEPNLLRAPRQRQQITDPRDAALAEQITLGVIQNHLNLQWLLESYSGRRLKSIDPLVQKIIAIGLYQLRFLDRIPGSAAVNEAVEQTRRFGRTKATGFVNAVLRKATREQPPALPDPRLDPITYAERALSHPRGLFQQFSDLLGPADALRLCEHDNREPPTIIRLFPGVSIAQLESPGITLIPHEQPGMYIVEPAKRATLADWAARGLAQPQDPTAAQVVGHLDIQPNQTLLDRCAGLGTKTFQLRDHLCGTGRIIAIDPAIDRIAALSALARARGFSNIECFEAANLSAIPALKGVQFDRALVDVPCSNSGVLARRPEARYTQTRAALQSLDRLQQQILEDTAMAIKPNGLLLYSTCSIWPCENQEPIARFLRRHPKFTRLTELSTLPSVDPESIRYRDGGYYAVLRRD